MHFAGACGARGCVVAMLLPFPAFCLRFLPAMPNQWIALPSLPSLPSPTCTDFLWSQSWRQRCQFSLNDLHLFVPLAAFCLAFSLFDTLYGCGEADMMSLTACRMTKIEILSELTNR